MHADLLIKFIHSFIDSGNMSQTIIYLLSILPLLYIASMTFCSQLALGTISLTSDWVLGDDSKQYRCYIGKIINKQNIIRDRITRSRLSYAYTQGL